MLDLVTRWFRRRQPSRPALPPRPQIAWHGEQDGPAEREFKVRCVQRLRLAPDIRKAYLAKATLVGAAAPGVVLVLAAPERVAPALLRDLSELAAAGLQLEAPVTLVTVRPGECAPIERACSAFYYAA